jgi:myo-inositol 2-dehydrogenase / D-chiro-inositol 1-dehydrogenase
VRLAIVGCGQVATGLHLPALRHVRDICVAAVADVDEARARAAADRYHVPQAFRDVTSLLANAQPDAVAVCVPPQYHREVARAVLEAKKHVFIEKPLTLSQVECEELVASAERSGMQAMCGFNYRWHPLIAEARQLISRGALGSVSIVRSAFIARGKFDTMTDHWRNVRREGGGVYWDLAVHHFDLWRFLVGSEAQEICTIGASGSRDDEKATISARMSNGVCAGGVFCYGSNDTNELEIYGSQGCLRLSLYRYDGLEFLPKTRLGSSLATRARKLAGSASRLPRVLLQSPRGGTLLSSYREEWSYFAQHIVNNKPVQCSTLDDGRRAVQMVLAAIESADSGRTCQIN